MTQTATIDHMIQQHATLPFGSLKEMCAAKWADGEGPMLNGMYQDNRLIAAIYNVVQQAAGNPTRATLY